MKAAELTFRSHAQLEGSPASLYPAKECDAWINRLKRAKAAHPPTRNGPPYRIPDLTSLPAGNCLKSAFEERRCNQQRPYPKTKQVSQISAYGHKPAVL